MPDSTAFAPAVRSTVIVTVPFSATLTGKDTHAPALKLVDRSAVWPFTEMVSRRAVESQSMRVQVDVAGKRFFEAQLHLDLVRVIVGCGVSRQLRRF